MEVETIRMSSKGQIVIPFDIREELGTGEGSVFAVIGSKDTIILKKMEMPSKGTLMKELEAVAKEGKKRLEAKGIKESDIVGIIHKRRNK